MLKAKKTNSTQDFSKSLAKKVVRVSYCSDEEIKQLKILSIMQDKSLKEMLNDSLLNIIKKPPKRFLPIDKNSPKRSFAISINVVKQMRLFLLDHDVSQEVLVYNAICRLVDGLDIKVK